MDPNTAIQVAGLGKQFGNKWAIRGVEFEVPRGVIFGFLGPNGAGKTTTIRTMMNFIKPTRGIVSIFGLDSQDNAKALHQRIGYVTGEMSYYENLTGQQYLRYIGNLQGTLDTKNINVLARRLKANLNLKIKKLYC